METRLAQFLSRRVIYGLGVMGALIIVMFLRIETFPSNGGFGHDGPAYAEMVRDLPGLIARDELSVYRAQRILPSVIVATGLNAADAAYSNANIINGFRALNLACLLASFLFWAGISASLNLRDEQYWLGFIGLFLNYTSLKLTLYNPVLTDIMAGTVGLAILWSYVTRRRALLIAACIIGAFVWQMSVPLAILLLLAENTVRAEPGLLDPRLRKHAEAWTPRIFLAVVPAGAALLLLALLAGAMPNDVALNLLTNLPMVALVFFFTAMLSWEYLGHWRLSLKPKRIVVTASAIVIVVVVTKAIVASMANPAIPPPGMTTLGDAFAGLLLERVDTGKPLAPLLAHTVFYGPLFLIMLLNWRKMIDAAVLLGTGFTAVLAVFAIFCIFSESRFTLLLWPFVVLMVVQSFALRRINTVPLLVIAATALFFSRVWAKYNVVSQPLAEGEGDGTKSLISSPVGLHLDMQYLSRAAIVVILLFILGWTLRTYNFRRNGA